MATNVMPEDISYDYFPEYPSPAGRKLGVEDMRRLYHSDDSTPQTLPPYHPWHWGQYQYPAAEVFYHKHDFYSPFYSSEYRPYTYEPDYWPSYYPHYNPASYYPYSYDPYYWANYYKGYDSAGSDGSDYESYEPAQGFSEQPAWEQYGDYYYDPTTGHVIMGQ
eukprot:3547145-Rhodomonas_salina.1